MAVPAATSMEPSLDPRNNFTGSEKIPRPRNAFIFFRSHFYKLNSVDEQGNRVDQSNLSKTAGAAWKKMIPEEKAPFYQMAENEKRHYSQRHPSYSYSSALLAGKERKKEGTTRRRRALSKPRSEPIEPASTSVEPNPPQGFLLDFPPPSPQTFDQVAPINNAPPVIMEHPPSQIAAPLVRVDLCLIFTILTDDIILVDFPQPVPPSCFANRIHAPKFTATTLGAFMEPRTYASRAPAASYAPRFDRGITGTFGVPLAVHYQWRFRCHSLP